MNQFALVNAEELHTYITEVKNLTEEVVALRNQIHPEGWITLEEAAAFMQLSEKSLKRKAADEANGIRYAVHGVKWHFYKPSLIKYLEKHEQTKFTAIVSKFGKKPRRLSL